MLQAARTMRRRNPSSAISRGGLRCASVSDARCGALRFLFLPESS